MHRIVCRGLLLITIGSCLTAATQASLASEPDSGSSASKTPLEHRAGLLTTYVDYEQGRIWLELPDGPQRLSHDLGTFIYVEGLASGLGASSDEQEWSLYGVPVTDC